MLIALSGTPGVGKTRAAEILESRGHSIVNLNQLAEEKGFVVGYDEDRDSKIIDVDALDEYILERFAGKDIILEGHLSHLLSVDLAIILRCNPLELEQRLKGKEWPQKKIKENLGAEILDVIKVEAFEVLDKVYEIDTTQRSSDDVVDTIERIIEGNYEDPKVDWLKKYEYLLFQ